MTDFSKSKPIVAGCIALMLEKPSPRWAENGANIHNPVRVIDFIKSLNSWQVDITTNRYQMVVEEKYLLRLDDPDTQQRIESEKELEHA